MKKNIVIGTRGSQLALWQANHVKSLLEKKYGIEVSLNIIKTKGDKIQDVPLSKVGGKGLFVKEIEEAMLRKEIDLAVHSMKDVPTEFPDGLGLVCILERENPFDVFVSNKYSSIKEMKSGDRLGTSSLRRQCQFLKLLPEIKVEFLRGNLDTRLKKAEEGEYDGIILAAAGMHRMGWKDRITEYLTQEDCVPAIAQGAIGIEARLNDKEVIDLLEPFNHTKSSYEVDAERAFLKTLEGGCQVPIGAYAQYNESDNTIFIEGIIGEPDGSVILKKSIQGKAEERINLGNKLAQELLSLGGKEILDRVYKEAI
ncbi:MAG: hydroxymethylbilane synthase [Nitrospinae bacterium]|nr:hydroxymethylbilane synthase [Nitrospinota bacterium]